MRDGGPSFGIWYIQLNGYCYNNEVFVPNFGRFYDQESTADTNFDRLIIRLVRASYCLSMIFNFFGLLMLVAEAAFFRVPYGGCFRAPMFGAGAFFSVGTFAIFCLDSCWAGLDWDSGVYRCDMGGWAWMWIVLSLVLFFMSFAQCCLPRADPIFGGSSS